MYKGFNLKFDINSDKETELYNAGKIIYDRKKLEIRKTLEELLLDNGKIDGSKMQENWFPQVKSDIFISHSHQDERKAIILAGILNSAFKIELFIDSCIWGNSTDLLKLIDNKYCMQDDGYYNYSKRNYSTSHVHMMLSIALNKMIDKTECLFFINTPNSITTSSLIEKTESPWIYSEIAMSKLLHHKELSRYRDTKIRTFAKGGKLSLNESFEYELDLSHLTDIDNRDLIKWIEEYNGEQYPLDVLYRQQYNKNIIGG